jgi:outer membrane biosynthesis protein TonB
VLKAMAQNPDQRFQSPVEFRDALRNAVQKGTAPAAPPPAPPPVSQTVEVQAAKGTNWTAIILGILLVIALAAVAFLVIPPLLDDDDVAVVDPTEPVVEQPTEAPEEPAPTEPPEEPPEQAPAPDDPVTLPVEQRPDICASLGFGAGIAVLGLTLSYPGRKRRTGTRGRTRRDASDIDAEA